MKTSRISEKVKPFRVSEGVDARDGRYWHIRPVGRLAALKPAVRKLSPLAQYILVKAAFTIPDEEAASFLWGTLYERAPRGQRKRNQLYDRARQEYDTAPRGQKQAIVQKYARGVSAESVLRGIRRRRKDDN